MLTTVFQKIRADGVHQKPASGRLGGIWSEDRWVLNELVAKLQDDGYTIVVCDVANTWSVRQTGSFPIHVDGITVEQFEQVASSYL